MARQGVRTGRFTAQSENNVEVKASQYFGSSCLASGEFLGCHEVLKVSMVGVDNGMESVGVAFQVVTPFLE